MGKGEKLEIVRHCGSLHGTARGLLLTGMFVTGAKSLIAQVTFERDHGRPDLREYAYSVVQSCNEGYYVTGSIGVPGSGHADGVLLKVAENGDTLWWRRVVHSDTTSAFLESLVCLDDGRLIVAGLVDLGVFAGYSDYETFVALLDSAGTPIWTRTSGGAYKQWGYEVRATVDSGFICVGWGQYEAPPDALDFYVVRLDMTGDTVWTRRYGTTDHPEQAFAIAPMSENTWVIAGVMKPSVLVDQAYVVRIDDQGDTLWTKVINSPDEPRAFATETLPNDHIVIAGWSVPVGCARPLLMELDENGNLLWFRNYDHGHCEWAYAMCKADPGYALFAFDSQEVLWLSRVDAEGDTLWSRNFTVGTLANRAEDIETTSDGGFVLTGVCAFMGTDGADYQVFLIKTDFLGNVTTSTQDVVLDRTISATLFPNPAEERATFRFNSINGGAYTLRLHDATGKVLRTYAEDLDLSPGQHDLPIDLNGLSRGGYTLVLSHAGRSVAVKAIKR